MKYFEGYYLGFKHVRFICVSYIITIHSWVWINLSEGKEFFLTSETFTGKLFLLGAIFPMMLPCIAGASYFIKTKESKSLGWDYAIEGFLFLYLVSSIFFTLNFGLECLFGWDVIPLVGLSLFVISIIPERGRVYILPLLMLIMGYFYESIFESLFPRMLQSRDATLSHSELYITRIIGVIWLFFLNAIFIVKKTIRKKLSMKALILIYNILVIVWFVNPPSNQDLIMNYNFPLSILVTDPTVHNIWPFFNWSVTVFFGYWLFDIFFRLKNLKQVRIALASFAVLLTAYWNLSGGSAEYFEAFNSNILWSSKLYSLSIDSLSIILASFCFHLIWTDFLETYLEWKLDWAIEMGGLVLWVYLIMNSKPIVALPNIFNKIIPTPYSYVLYSLIIHYLIFKVGRFLLRKKLKFQFRKII